MRILGLVGSMRKTGNTNRLVSLALDGAKKAGDDVLTEVVYLSDLVVGPCRACYDLCAKEAYVCAVKDDLQMVFEKMKEADAIIIGSPLYFILPSRLVALTERLACVSYFSEWRGFKEAHPLDDKPCGFIAVAAGDTPQPVLPRLLDFALSLKMRPLMLKDYPYLGVCGRGDLDKDKDWKPLERAEQLGRLVVEAAKGQS